ncbi:helix-turn-helix domain-containing protein [Marinifilum caeruleilacunae]|uniref:Helix-turn-helix domain-containing protein n=1 Tax=Marinifilum caeruleilacunae TaxID=2499076 RepID=A0ABX1X218_9BACT|nr:helix-turn-helix domain-containing protein [Marinifilum caeruleilacunae]NOU62134.1 helix-turn-helix domain-containing protein [Marinifilum caeruleilacunae]
MYTKQEIIIQSYREGKSQRVISRDLQTSRRTVKKYIEEYENQIATSDDIEYASSQYLGTAPVYKKRACTTLKLTQEIQDTIDKLLEENNQKKQQGLRKQMLNK